MKRPYFEDNLYMVNSLQHTCRFFFRNLPYDISHYWWSPNKWFWMALRFCLSQVAVFLFFEKADILLHIIFATSHFLQVFLTTLYPTWFVVWRPTCMIDKWPVIKILTSKELVGLNIIWLLDCDIIICHIHKKTFLVQTW